MKINFDQLCPSSGQVLRGSEGVEGGGAEERSEDLETSSQPAACQGRRECCRRGEVGKLFAFTDFREFAYFEHFKVLCDGLLPPQRPPSHPLPLPHLAGDHPRLLWTHIQVFRRLEKDNFSANYQRLAFSVLTRSTSPTTLTSGSGFKCC